MSAKRLNIKIENCWGCPYVIFQDYGYDAELEEEFTGHFCRLTERLVLEDGVDYKNVYGKGFPDFCQLEDDDFDPVFEE
jgi:hypothetical protein